MSTYTKVYMRNKKESNISLPLRYSLLRSIFVDNMSVKNAAIKWKVHYSSAKIIARTAKRNKLYFLFDHFESLPNPPKQSSYKEIEPNQPQDMVKSDANDSDNSNNAESITYSSQLAQKRIEICSTIGWTYLSRSSQSAP